MVVSIEETACIKSLLVFVSEWRGLAVTGDCLLPRSVGRGEERRNESFSFFKGRSLLLVFVARFERFRLVGSLGCLLRREAV